VPNELEQYKAVVRSLNEWINGVEAKASDSYEKGLAAIIAGNVRELLGPFADPHAHKDEPWW